MAKTSIKYSLEAVLMQGCGVTGKLVKKMVDKHGFTGVKHIETHI
jgi:hypothetical protein